VDPGSAPEGIGKAHVTDQLAYFELIRRPKGLKMWIRRLSVSWESFSVPSSLPASPQGRIIGFVANFVCGRCGPETTTLITPPANRIAALDAICSSRATGPCGSYA
jgi:hypothetical protein